MQLNAITRKSAFMAIILLVMMLVAVALRYCFTPFAWNKICRACPVRVRFGKYVACRVCGRGSNAFSRT